MRTTTDQAGASVEASDFVRYHGSKAAQCPVTLLKVEHVRDDGRMDLVHDGAHPFHVRGVRPQSVTRDHAPESGVAVDADTRKLAEEAAILHGQRVDEVHEAVLAFRAAFRRDGRLAECMFAGVAQRAFLADPFATFPTHTTGKATT
ncbi:hypothetical protein [Amycolatopsis pigmentata]|uniref:Uncharacterized protein n=1 Tax=Amycolatopsis pigmentata TaxID=450801 RepID=A0ABW5G2Z7_9PSEU